MYSMLSLLILVHLCEPGYASPKEGQSLADYLWEQTAEYQQQALNSSYIHGLKEICLDPSEFGAFMVQDAVYLYEGMVSMNKAAARSNTNATVQNFLKSNADDWKGYYESMYEAWHIKTTEGIQLGNAAEKYVSDIRKVADEEEPVYTILALTPCAKLWPWLGKQIGSGKDNFGVYTSWVEYNLDPTYEAHIEFENYVEWAYQAGQVTATKALEIFTTSIENEVAFFNSVTRCTSGNVP